MAFEGLMEEFLSNSNMTDSNAILRDMVDPKNIRMKTHIADPLTFSFYDAIVSNFESLLIGCIKGEDEKRNFPLIGKLLDDQLKKLLMELVSWNRLSRNELKEILAANKEREDATRSFFQRIAGFGR